MTSSRSRSGLGSSLRILAVAGGILILAGAAVLMARGDASQEIAEGAQVLTWAESVRSASATLQGEVREGLVISQSAAHGVFDEEAVAGAVERMSDAATELDRRADILGELVDTAMIQDEADNVVAHVEQLAGTLREGAVEEALLIAESDLGPSLEALSSDAASLSEERADHIAAVTAGVGDITTAARFVSALLIPILAVYLIYRAMRKSQKVSLLKTELRREQELRRKKDAFIAAASHHIRTPLASVVGFSELLRLKSRDFNAGVRNEVTELLALEAKETANVADDLLAAARSDLGELALKKDEIELRDIVDSVASDWAANQRMRLTISGNAVVVGDERWLAHAVRNLLRNAASFGGQQIRVDIRSFINRVVIEVSDNGDPIPAEERDRIFDLYYSYRQIEGLAPSLGLGLSVAQRVVRAMGGELEYHRLEQENVFEVKLDGAAGRPAQIVTPALTIDPTDGAPDLDAITRVIEEGGPAIVYQPIVDLTADDKGRHRVIGYEALAHFGSQSPSQWFDSASAVEMRLDLELVCIARAVEGFDPPDEGAFLAVNVSDRTLHTSRLEDVIEGIDPTRLVLELSEAASIKSYEETSRVLDTMAARGIRLAVDDVGSGDVDLWHIARIGAHMIKIDMSLVHELRESLRSRALVKAVAAMATELGAPAIAEGIETKEQHTILEELGVRFGQGYLFGRPDTAQGDGRFDGWAVSQAS